MVFALPAFSLGDVRLEDGLPAPFISLVYTLYFVYVLRGTRYVITNRRVVTRRPVLFLGKREKVLSLLSLMDVRTKRILGTSAVEFRTSSRKTLKFGMLNDDPEKVRQMALDALSKFRPST